MLLLVITFPVLVPYFEVPNRTFAFSEASNEIRDQPLQLCRILLNLYIFINLCFWKIMNSKNLFLRLKIIF